MSYRIPLHLFSTIRTSVNNKGSSQVTNNKRLAHDMTAEERIKEIAEILSNGLIRKRFQALYQKDKRIHADKKALNAKI